MQATNKGTVTGNAEAFRQMGLTAEDAIKVDGDEWVIPHQAWKVAAANVNASELACGQMAAARAGVTWDNGSGDRDEAMSQLAEAFHVLERVPGVRPWNPRKLMEHWQAGLHGSAEHHACLFVLNVWNTTRVGDEKASWPAFDVHAAYGCWDLHNRGAFIGWAEQPWWP